MNRWAIVKRPYGARCSRLVYTNEGVALGCRREALRASRFLRGRRPRDLDRGQEGVVLEAQRGDDFVDALEEPDERRLAVGPGDRHLADCGVGEGIGAWFNRSTGRVTLWRP